MQGELILPVWVCGTCPKSFTHGKIAWASNMTPFELNFYIFVELHQLPKRERLKGPCLVLVIE
jgi:hypothetical protein